MRKIAFTFGGFSDAFRVMPGAGIAKTYEDVEDLVKNDDITFIIVGSITVLERLGNPGTQIFIDPNGDFSVNSVGMMNLGKVKYLKILKEIAQLVHSKGKKLIVSVAAVASYKEYAELVQLCIDCGADGVELNFGCPNVKDGGAQHVIPSFDPKNLDTILAHIQQTLGFELTIPVWVKISPLIQNNGILRIVQSGKQIKHTFKINEQLTKEVCNVLNKYAFIKAVICTNTIGNVCVVDDDLMPVLGPNPNNPTSNGGLAGKALRGVGIAQTKLMRTLLNKEIDIITAGGIETGKDMDEAIQAGAVAVQSTTPWFRTEDPGVWSVIASEYATLSE